MGGGWRKRAALGSRLTQARQPLRRAAPECRRSSTPWVRHHAAGRRMGRTRGSGRPTGSRRPFPQVPALGGTPAPCPWAGWSTRWKSATGTRRRIRKPSGGVHVRAASRSTKATTTRRGRDCAISYFSPARRSSARPPRSGPRTFPHAPPSERAGLSPRAADVAAAGTAHLSMFEAAHLPAAAKRGCGPADLYGATGVAGRSGHRRQQRDRGHTSQGRHRGRRRQRCRTRPRRKGRHLRRHRRRHWSAAATRRLEHQQTR